MKTSFSAAFKIFPLFAVNHGDIASSIDLNVAYRILFACLYLCLFIFRFCPLILSSPFHLPHLPLYLSLLFPKADCAGNII